MSEPALPALTLTRFHWGDEGTFSNLVLPDGKVLICAELPWRDNKNDISCIPAGDYVATHIVRTPSGRSEVFALRDVPGRTGVLIHVGNYAGDVTRGFKTHSQGCILPGRVWGTLLGQRAVLASAPAMRQLNKAVDRKNFLLKIRYAGA